jgi:flagellin-like hook-associated protein FlgL
MMVSQFLKGLRNINQDLLINQYKLTTGTNYSKPSDGPLEVGQILNFKSQEKRIVQYQKSIADGLGQMEYVDTLLQSMVSRLTEARTDIVHAGDDALNSDDRKTLALGIDQYLMGMLESSQSLYQDKFLFAGYETLTNPFSANYSKWDQYVGSIDYKGDMGQIPRRIGAESRSQINVNGQKLFLERTYTLKGKALPTNRELGFSGTLIINDIKIDVGTDDTLDDIRDKINTASNIKVTANTDGGYLKLESTTSSDEIKISDDMDGVLLDNLGLNLRGAFNRGIAPPTLPVIDSTGAIFDAAGTVTNLTIDSTNNVLNIHLGQNANNGVNEAHSITIPEGTYATTAELASAIQTQIDGQFGENKIIVEDNAGALRFTTFETGASIGTSDLQIGGEIDGVLDTASDSADLNLIASPDPAPQTLAGTAGTDGTDKFNIDIGDKISRDGTDPVPVEIDLRALNTGTLAEMIDEINYQLSQDLTLRGLVEASSENGRVVIKTIATGSDFTADQLQLTDSTTGTLIGLGLMENASGAFIDGIPPAGYPVTIVAGVNDTIQIDLGPSVSYSGMDVGPITIKLREGNYADINALAKEINTQILTKPDLIGGFAVTVDGPAGFEFIRLSSIDDGSDVRGIDLRITGGTALADLGLSVATAVDGGGTSGGKGLELMPENIFNTLISIRDSLLGYAKPDAEISGLQNSEHELLDIFEGDTITFEEGGRTRSITFRSTDTIADLAHSLQEFLGSKVSVSVDRTGRIVIDNETTQKISGLSIHAENSLGESRELFNELFKIDSDLPGSKSIATGSMFDPTRSKNVSTDFLNMIDRNTENFLKHQSFIGATTNRLERNSTLLTSKDSVLKTNRANIESVDVADIIMRLSQQETQLQAALNVGSRVLTMSLLDYL